MSKRFLTWVQIWIDENIRPGNSDIESFEAQGKRYTAKVFAEAEAAGFSKFETDEERKRVPVMVQNAISPGIEFDIDAYKLKTALAQEHEDGD